MSNQNIYDLTMVFSFFCLLCAFYFLFKSDEFKDLKNDFDFFKSNDFIDVLNSQRTFNNIRFGKNNFGLYNLDYFKMNDYTKVNVLSNNNENNQNLVFDVSSTTNSRNKIKFTNQNYFNDIDWVPA